MTKLKEIYKCSVCGNIVEVLHESYGTLVCCNQPMELLQELTEDNGLEKHVPVVEIDGSNVTVKVGEVEHPMEEEHFIEWIELVVDGKSYRKFLSPKDTPEAKFIVEKGYKEIYAREYCNLHGLWRS